MALLMTMEKQSDHELTRLAAKAAGYDWVRVIDYKPLDHCGFNPLGDDGDALRLAVKLNLEINIGTKFTLVISKPLGEGVRIMVEQFSDPLESTRIAIVRAAAEIGRRIQDEQSTAATG